MLARANCVIALRSEGVSLVLDVSAGRLPAVVHWGADMGFLELADAEGLIFSNIDPGGPNLVDEPMRLAVLPEHWTGWVGRPGLSGSRAGRDWSPKFTATEVRVDGKPVAATETQPVMINTGPGSVAVDAVDEVAGLQLSITIELTAGGLIRARAEVINGGEDRYTVEDCVIAFPIPQNAREILDLAGYWSKERVPQRGQLGVGVHLREGRKGRTGSDAATVLHVGEPGFCFSAGEIWAVHTAWSGNHTHYAERLFTGVQVLGGGELLLPGEVILQPGQSYRTPWIYGAYGRGLDAVAGRFHRFLRARDNHPSTARPVTLNVWEAVYFDHDLDQLVELAERAAAIGVERYVLDDGWFGARRNDHAGLGDWTVSPQVWPQGLHPLVDKVTGLGMEFGLWFEPEMVNLDSAVARAHPDWIMATGNRLPVESRHQQVINLAIPQCYAYIRDAIFDILAEYKIGYLKWDHNRDLIDAGSPPDGRPGVHEQTLAFYRLVDEIKATHPGLEIESCSSGGARVDLAVLERTDRIWVSDCIDPLERQQMNRWTSQLLPPELLGSHIASTRSHTTGRVHSLSFRAATAVFGHLGIEWDLTTATAQDLAQLAEWVSFYKANRTLLMSGDLVRLDLPDPTIYGYGILAPDRSSAIYTVASIGRSDVMLHGRLRFPGLEPNRRYRLRPIPIGHPPSGLNPPPWWGATTGEFEPSAEPRTHDWGLPPDGGTGLVLTGAVLAAAGVTVADTHPEQAVLYRADALDTAK
jgi:alpha-galactosidase